MTVDLAFDGGCRDNPNGIGSAGAVVCDPDGRTLRHVGLAITAPASNNVAEWTGLLIGLEAARDLGATTVRAFGDSKLVVEQFTGNYAIREERLRMLAMDAFKVRAAFAGGVTIAHVPREHNRAADAICRAVLAGSYQPDADLDEATAIGGVEATLTADDVEVAFVVAVRMDRRAAATAFARGSTVRELRKAMAQRVESKLLLAGAIGEYSVTASRVKG